MNIGDRVWRISKPWRPGWERPGEMLAGGVVVSRERSDDPFKSVCVVEVDPSRNIADGTPLYPVSVPGDLVFASRVEALTALARATDKLCEQVCAALEAETRSLEESK